MSQLKITLMKSGIGEKPPVRKTVRALGLRRPGQTVTHEDTPAIRGMVQAVRHLVSVEEEH